MSSLNEKIDEAVSRGLESRRAQAALKQSADAQAEAFWLKLKAAVKQGAERINQNVESARLAGGTLIFDSKSETEFSVKTEILPGRTVTVRNCTAFINVDVLIRTFQGHSRETKQEPESNEEFHFKMNDDGLLFVVKDDNGRKFYDAADLAVYALEAFWKSELRDSALSFPRSA